MTDDTSGHAVPQWTASQERNNLRLIPPLAEEFTLYGGKDTTERARQWALKWRYLLADGVPACAHGLYLMPSCPGLDTCRNNFRQLDHASLWVPVSAAGRSLRPFLLSHPYSDEISEETRAYAHAHGLVLGAGVHHPDDGWYGRGALPVRMTIPQSWPLWPIEAAAVVLLHTQPVAWPDDDEAMTERA